MIDNALAAAGILSVSDQLANGMLDTGNLLSWPGNLGGNGSDLGRLISGSNRGVHHRSPHVKAAGFTLAETHLDVFSA